MLNFLVLQSGPEIFILKKYLISVMLQENDYLVDGGRVGMGLI